MTTHDTYLPAAGRHWLLPLYDPLLRLFTREKRWRGRILEALELTPGDIVVDVGCGTGTLAVMAKQRVPQAEVIGIDPDPQALARATKKAQRKGLSIALHQGFGNETARLVGEGRVNKAVSSLAFHHMPAQMQAETLAAMWKALKPGGLLRIADFSHGHFPGPTGQLVRDINVAGFQNARTLERFRIAFSDVTLVGAEKPRA